MTEPAISIRNLSKCYRLGTIGRHTLVDEVAYWWYRFRGRDPRGYFSKVGHTATEQRKVEAEREGSQQFWALKDVSFDVHPGEVIGIIGGNGAGKSTLLKLLTRITEPTSGEAVINGRVASLLEVGTGFHPELTGRENIYMNGTILGMKKREIDAKLDEIVAFSEIEKFIDTPVKRYSSGMYVRLAFSVAAHLEPEIMLVDEVLAVGDAKFQAKCLGRMGEVAQEGRTVLFVSHNMPAVQNLCPRCIFIKEGRINMDDSTSTVMKTYLEAITSHESSRDLVDLEIERSGNGKARFERGEILTIDRQPSSLFPMGEGICVRLQIHAYSDVPDASIFVAIFDAQGSRVCRFHSTDTMTDNFNLEKGKVVVIDCLIPEMNLMPGIYQLNIGIQDDTSRKQLDFISNVLRFDVVPADIYGTGRIPAYSAVVFFPVRWEKKIG